MGGLMSSWTYGQTVVAPETPRRVLECAYCGEELRIGERCVDYFRGVVGIGEKSGQPIVVEDQYDPEDPAVFHEECHEMWRSESKQDEEEELMRFCAGCGCKLNGD
jgi:hypothetical protein